jgi:hypothetical protein
MKLGGRGIKVMKFSEREGETLGFNFSTPHFDIQPSLAGEDRCMNRYIRKSGGGHEPTVVVNLPLCTLFLIVFACVKYEDKEE